MLASAKSGYKRIFSTICYTSALSGTFYLSYKYKYNNINLYPSIFTNAQCEKGGAVIDAYLSDLAEDTIDDHFHLRSSIAQVKKVCYPITAIDIISLYIYNNDNNDK